MFVVIAMVVAWLQETSLPSAKAKSEAASLAALSAVAAGCQHILAKIT